MFFPFSLFAVFVDELRLEEVIVALSAHFLLHLVLHSMVVVIKLLLTASPGLLRRDPMHSSCRPRHMNIGAIMRTIGLRQLGNRSGNRPLFELILLTMLPESFNLNFGEFIVA